MNFFKRKVGMFSGKKKNNSKYQGDEPPCDNISSAVNDNDLQTFADSTTSSSTDYLKSERFAAAAVDAVHDHDPQSLVGIDTFTLNRTTLVDASFTAVDNRDPKKVTIATSCPSNNDNSRRSFANNNSTAAILPDPPFFTSEVSAAADPDPDPDPDQPDPAFFTSDATSSAADQPNASSFTIDATAAAAADQPDVSSFTIDATAAADPDQPDVSSITSEAASAAAADQPDPPSFSSDANFFAAAAAADQPDPSSFTSEAASAAAADQPDAPSFTSDAASAAAADQPDPPSITSDATFFAADQPDASSITSDAASATAADQPDPSSFTSNAASAAAAADQPDVSSITSDAASAAADQPDASSITSDAASYSAADQPDDPQPFADNVPAEVTPVEEVSKDDVVPLTPENIEEISKDDVVPLTPEKIEEIPVINRSLSLDLEVESCEEARAHAKECFVRLPRSVEELVEMLLYKFQFGDDILPTNFSVQEICSAILSRFSVESYLRTDIFSEQVVENFLENLSEMDSEDKLCQARVWLQEVRPVNMSLLIKMIEETENAAKSVENKNVVLFVGSTGVGKSSLIHFLSGSTFTKSDNKLHITPSKLVDVSSIYTSSRMQSTTRFINPVVLTSAVLSALGANPENDPNLEMILCDSPGLGDTNGPEMDISNVIGVTRAMQNSNSVRLLLVTSNQIGDRGQYFRKITESLVAMLDNIQSHANAYSFVFTKWNNVKEITQTLPKIRDKVVQDLTAKSDCAIFMKKMNSTMSEKGVFLIDPVNDDPIKLLKLLLASECISNPKQAFKNFISMESLPKLREQLRLHEKAIKTYLHHGEIDFVIIKMKQLQAVNKKIFTITGDQAGEIPEVRDCTGEIVHFIIAKVNTFDSVCSRVTDVQVRCISSSDIELLTLTCEELFALKEVLPYVDLEEVEIDCCFTKLEKVALDLSERFAVNLHVNVDYDLILPEMNLTLPIRKDLENASYSIGKVFQLCNLFRNLSTPLLSKLSSTLEYITAKYLTMQKMLNQLVEYCATTAHVKFDVLTYGSWEIALNAITTMQLLLELFDEAHIDRLFETKLSDFRIFLAQEYVAHEKYLSDFFKNDINHILETSSTVDWPSIFASNKLRFDLFYEFAGNTKLIAHFSNATIIMDSVNVEQTKFRESLSSTLMTLLSSSTNFIDFKVVAVLLRIHHILEKTLQSNIASEVSKRLRQCSSIIMEENRKLEANNITPASTSHFINCFCSLSSASAYLKPLDFHLYDDDYEEACITIVNTLVANKIRIAEYAKVCSLTNLEPFERLFCVCIEMNNLAVMLKPYSCDSFPRLDDVKAILEDIVANFADISKILHLKSLDAFGITDRRFLELEVDSIYGALQVISLVDQERESSNNIEEIIESFTVNLKSFWTKQWEYLKGVARNPNFDFSTVESGVKESVDIICKMASKLSMMHKTFSSKTSISEFVAINFYKLFKTIPRDMIDNGELIQSGSLVDMLQLQIVPSETNQLKQILHFVHSLQPLDKISGSSGDESKSYRKLLEDIRENLQSRVNDLSSIIKLLIDEGKFGQIPVDLDDLMRDFDEKDCNECIDYLQSNMKKTAESLSSLLVKHRNNVRDFTIADVQEVLQGIFLLKLANLHIAKYCRDISVESMLAASLSSLENLIQSRIDAADKYIIQNIGLVKIEKEMIFLRKLTTALSSTLHDNLAKCVKIALHKLFDSQSEFLNNSIKSISCKEVTKYAVDPPNSFAESLLQCSQLEDIGETGDNYVRIRNDLMSMIIDNFRSHLIRNEGEMSIDDFEEQVNAVNRALPHVPSEVRSVINELYVKAIDGIALEKRAIQEENEKLDMTRQLHQYIEKIHQLGDRGVHQSTRTMISNINRFFGEKWDIFRAELESRNFNNAIALFILFGPEMLFYLAQMKSLHNKAGDKTIYHPIITRSRPGYFSSYEDHWYNVPGRGYYYIPPAQYTQEMRKTKLYPHFEPANRTLQKLYSSEVVFSYFNSMVSSLHEKLILNLANVDFMTMHQLGDQHGVITALLQFIDVKPSSVDYIHGLLKPNWANIQIAICKIHSLLNEFIAFSSSTLDNISEIKLSLEICKRISGVIEPWKKIIVPRYSEFGLSEINLDAISYSIMQAALNDRLIKWTTNLATLKYSDNPATTTRNGLDRDKFYQDVSRSYEAVKNIGDLSGFGLASLGDCLALREKCTKHITSEIKKIMKKLDRLKDQMPFELEELYYHCNYTYDNLRSIEESFDDPCIIKEAKQQRDVAANMFTTKFRTIQAKICSVKEVGEKLTGAHIESVINDLINLQTCANKMPCFAAELDSIIDSTLADLRKGLDGSKRFGLIAMNLKKRIQSGDSNEHINSLLKHRDFDEISVILRNKKTKAFTIYNVLGFEPPGSNPKDHLVPCTSVGGSKIESADLKDNWEARKELYKLYTAVDTEYWCIVESGLGNKKVVMSDILARCNDVLSESDRTQKILSLMSIIFAYWTLHRYTGGGTDKTQAVSQVQTVTTSSSTKGGDPKNEELDDPRDSLVQPHAAQVTAILRMLGVGSSKLKGHFVQIGTGEGKSVVLAVTSTILALLGNTVNCACYSAYLSTRDFEEFSFMFSAFNVANYIKYGTFGGLCEDFINSEGNIRSRVEEMMCGLSQSSKNSQTQNMRSSSSTGGRRPKILLIDEVDTFFNSKYYGKLYQPLSQIKDTTIANIAKLLWRERKSRMSYKKLQETAEFQACMTRFGAWSCLAEEIIKGMMCDLITVTDSKYFADYQVLQGEKIGYKEEDGYNPLISRDYETMFTYMKEHEDPYRTISAASVERELVGRLRSGGFSYAEIPKQYDCIMGVTGTLKQIVEGPEGEILHGYKIDHFTYVPSVYSSSEQKYSFAKDSERDVAIVENNEYFIRIDAEIRGRITSNDGSEYKRAVFVFFDSMDILQQFYDDPVFRDLRSHALVLTEKVSPEQKEGIIRSAASSGQIVLITKAFGRGTDFMCYDDRMNKVGGVHVLQTFFSTQVTEEVQIQGRTARQGSLGSYGLVIRYSDLDKFGMKREEIDKIKSSGVLYSSLNAYRNAYYSGTLFPIVTNGIKEIASTFSESMEFKRNLLRGNVAASKEFLMKYNKVDLIAPQSCRTIVVMDATGSMGGLIELAKTAVKTMFSRLSSLMRENASVPAELTIQFVVYRNYNSTNNEILEVSAWEPLSENPAKLYSFMDRITAKAGSGPGEAVEVGFAHVLAEHSVEPVAQVVLIGDCQCNTAEEVIGHRNRYSFNTQAMPLLKEPTSCEAQLPIFAEKHIPIHSFYLKDGRTKSCFELISAKTGGISQDLEVSQADAGQKLTDVVCLHIARAAGGDELANAYRRIYKVPVGYMG